MHRPLSVCLSLDKKSDWTIIDILEFNVIISAKLVPINWAQGLLNSIKMQVGSLQRQVAFFLFHTSCWRYLLPPKIPENVFLIAFLFKLLSLAQQLSKPRPLCLFWITLPWQKGSRPVRISSLMLGARQLPGFDNHGRQAKSIVLATICFCYYGGKKRNLTFWRLQIYFSLDKWSNSVCTIVLWREVPIITHWKWSRTPVLLISSIPQNSPIAFQVLCKDMLRKEHL